ncbi:MAG: group II intron maturase-specific domain-containing protein [Pseudomonadota bacterium]
MRRVSSWEPHPGKALRKCFPKRKINLVRYADNFIVTGASREFLEQVVVPFIKAFLAERVLQLSKEKTRLTHIREGVDFLGHNVRKYGQEGKEKLLIKPSKPTVKSVLSKAKAIFKKKVSSKTVNVVRELNPVLRGWANYHRHVCSKKVFSKVDWRVGGMILKWAKRRHPNKSMDWIHNKYLTTRGGEHWVFYGRGSDAIAGSLDESDVSGDYRSYER